MGDPWQDPSRSQTAAVLSLRISSRRADDSKPCRDARQVLNSIFYMVLSRAKCHNLPERYAPWKTVYDRFRQWRDEGNFEAVLILRATQAPHAIVPDKGYDSDPLCHCCDRHHVRPINARRKTKRNCIQGI